MFIHFPSFSMPIWDDKSLINADGKVTGHGFKGSWTCNVTSIQRTQDMKYLLLGKLPDFAAILTVPIDSLSHSLFCSL